MQHLRIRPLGHSIQHACVVCGEDAVCHHIDLDFRTAGYVCDECKHAVISAECLLINSHLCAPVDRALDAL